MHQSTSSFRGGTRYSTSSQSRRQYLSNQAPLASSSQHHVGHNHSHAHGHGFPTLLQQQQIEGLQQKIDMILIHNNQLLEENAELKKTISLLNIREVDNRYSSIGGEQQIYRLNRQLQLKILQIDDLTHKSTLQKQSQTQQLNQLNGLLSQLRLSYQKQTLEKQSLEKQLHYYNSQKQHIIQKIKQQYQNEVYQTSLKKQIEHKDELREKQYELDRILDTKAKQWEQERQQLEESKINSVIQIEEKMRKSKDQEIAKLEQQWKIRFGKLEAELEEKCRRVRDQSQAYIKTILQQNSQQERSDQQLKNQIEGLKQSLQNRQKIIQSLLAFPSAPTQSHSSQIQHLQTRIKQLTQSFFKQTQLLKVKQAIKHDIDIRETTKVYQNKIEILTSRLVMVTSAKDSLRQKYEQEIRAKMNQRHKFEVEVSKLKNYIRKMKIQLESYGKEMRLNIEGIRDQANSFSMSILGELGQEKNKKNFYQEEIRKMREVVDLKEHEMDVLTKQSQEKLKYYDEKLKSSRQQIQSLADQLQQQQQTHRLQLDTYKESTKLQLQRQKQHNTQSQKQLKKQILDLRKLSQKLQQRIKEQQIKCNDLQKQLQKALHEIEAHKSHIDSLKLEMEMLGENTANQHTQSLKQHYERIVKQLEEDKAILKQDKAIQQLNMNKLIAKYTVLEKSMEKTLSTLKKKTLLENRVMELGMDGNLVKNLAELFKRNQSGDSADRTGGSQRKDKEKQNYT